MAQAPRLKRVALRSISMKAGFMLLGTATSVLLGRMLGASEYGLYAFALAVVNVLVIVTQLGLPTLLVKEISAYDAHSKWSEIKGILTRANQLVLLLSVVVGLAVLVPVIVLDDYWSPKAKHVAYALPLLLLLSLGNLRGAALRGLHYVALGQLPEQIIRPSLLIAGIGLYALLLGSASLNAQDAIALNIGAAAMTFVIGAALLWGRLPNQIKRNAPTFETSRWIATTVPLALVAGLQVINAQAGIIALGMFSSTEEIGIYRAAVQSATLVSFTLPAMNMALGPRISRLFALEETGELQSSITWAARLIFISALPMCVIFIFFGKQVLDLVFGEEFGPGGLALSVLSIGQLVNVATGSVGLILAMTGNAKLMAIGAGLGAALNVLLNLMLVPQFGMIGAAVAATVAVSAWNLTLAYLVYRRTGLVSHPFTRKGQSINV